MFVSRKMTSVVVAIVAITLSGCGAIGTMIKKRNLDVQTKMSETVFMEPVKPSDKVIYLSVRNTSDKKLKIKALIASKLKESGYSITKNPELARFMLQANVLKLGKSDLRSAQGYLSAGYGGVAGAAVGLGVSGNYKGAIGGSLIGASLGFLGDMLVDDVLFLMVTDLQVRERPQKGEIIRQRQCTQANIGTATTMQQEVTGAEINWNDVAAHLFLSVLWNDVAAISFLAFLRSVAY